MNALLMTEPPGVYRASPDVVSPLSRSSSLQNISEQAVAMARLYGHGVLCRTINDARWRFRWCCIDTPLSGVELRLRIGGAEAAVLVEDLASFGSAVDVVRAQLPAALRTAYLIGLGASVWRDLEALAGCAVQVLDVEPDRTMGLNPDCVGFEVENAFGVKVRGFLRPIHSELPDILLRVSHREMADTPRPPNLRIRWSAIVGSTTLTASEARALEEQDIVVVDGAVYDKDGLACRLGVGAHRHYAGRAMLRRDGRLRIVEFTSKGQATMKSSAADAPSAEQTKFDDLPVSLRFEVARWDAPLAEVANLATGAIIDLGHPIDEQSVTVWVEQRCIGKGQLVAIGERLGVRLLTVFAPGT